MDIVGTGFLARHLQPLRDRHPAATALAAGVPRHPLPNAEHERELRLVGETIRDCRRRGRLLVFFSTVSMYGAPGCRGREDEPVVPSTRYGRHKLRLEEEVRGGGVPHLLLRLSYVIGPHGPSFRLVPALIAQIRAGRVRVQPGARRDILHVTDFVTVLDRLLALGVQDEIVNVASGDCVDIVDIVAHLEARLGLRPEHDEVHDDVLSHCASVARLRALVPEAAAWGPGYHRRAIDRYLVESGNLAAV